MAGGGGTGIKGTGVEGVGLEGAGMGCGGRGGGDNINYLVKIITEKSFSFSVKLDVCLPLMYVRYRF